MLAGDRVHDLGDILAFLRFGVAAAAQVVLHDRSSSLIMSSIIACSSFGRALAGRGGSQRRRRVEDPHRQRLVAAPALGDAELDLLARR